MDPGSFADAVITIINDGKTPDAPLDKDLASAVKGLESALPPASGLLSYHRRWMDSSRSPNLEYEC